MNRLTVADIARGERLRAVTDNLFFWQGLRFLALGPVMMLVGIAAALPSVDEAAAIIALVATVAAAIVASCILGRRYREQLGSVRAVAGAHATRSRVKWLLVYPAMFGALALDMIKPMPVLVSGLVWAVTLILYRASTGGGRGHYLVLAGAVAALTFLPLLTSATSKEAISFMLVVLGAGYSICAWLDDRELRSILTGG